MIFDAMQERSLNRAYLLIGGNIGNRSAFLKTAREKLEACCGIIEKQSSLYQTAPWGHLEQEVFLNQALLLSTELKAEALLEKILEIESEMGRKRELKYGPRIIDIDILLFNNEVVRSERLIIPHPEMQNRRFALVPLNEIAAGAVHPLLGKNISELLQECPDQLDVHKIE